MRITADQKIAGYPVVQIRQLMRETVGRSITLRYVRKVLQCFDSAASSVLNLLHKDGFIQSVGGNLGPSTVSVRATASMHGSLSVLKWNHGGIGKAASQAQEQGG